MKKIWIINHYASEMLDSKGGRHYCFAKYLKQAGCEPVIFCCNSKHNSAMEQYLPDMRDLGVEKQAEDIDVPFVFVKGRPYLGNGKQRVLNMLDFYVNVQKAAAEYAKEHGKPDVIIGSSVHPLACVAAIRLSQKLKCRNIVEIRDLWPESIVAYGVKPRTNPIIKALYRLEKWIYTKADAIIFTMEGGRDYIIEKGWDKEHGGPVDLNKVHHINNGVDLEQFDYNCEHYTVDDPELEDGSVFKAVYCGSIREVNHVEKLVDAAAELKKQGSSVKLLIYGSGDKLDGLQKSAVEMDLDNIEFKGKVDKNYIPYILSKCGLCLMHGEASPITQYGMSLNKSFEYLASGKPILSTLPNKYDFISSNHCGVTLDDCNASDYAAAIQNFADMPPAAYDEYCKNARKTVEEYDYMNLTATLLTVLETQT